jgi:hypothetical protein
VFAPEYLDVAGSFVHARRMSQGDTSFWRYTGLRLLTYSDGQWFLLTGRYGSTYRSSVVVMKNDDRIRVEIAVPAASTMSATGG